MTKAGSGRYWHSLTSSTLDETITYYRDVLIPGLEEQGVSLKNMIDELSSSWSGVHADTYRESLYGLIYGNGEADSLALVIQKAKNILKALEAGEEVFLTEMSRCDEFPVMLTDVSVNPFMNPAPKVPMDEYLLCNYEAVESLCTKISNLMETDCAYPEGGANSQIGRWNALVSVFESGLQESSYSPGYSNVLVQHALEQEYTKLRNFDYGLRTYHCNLGQIEENLMEAFGAETSESAKTLTREIYEVMQDGTINKERLLYLGTKAPQTLTPAELSEIRRVLDYTFTAVSTAVNEFAELEMNLLRNYIFSLLGTRTENPTKESFTEQELEEMYLCMETQEDKRLFEELMKGDYTCAFQIDPQKLSPSGSFLLVSYTNRLTEKEDMQEMQKLLNELLYTDETHSFYPNSSGFQTYGVEYLKRLYAGSSYMLDQNMNIFMNGSEIFTEEGEKALCRKIELQADTNVLWGTLLEVACTNEYFEVCGIEVESMQLLYGGRVEDLEHSGAGFSFDYCYSTARIGDPGMECAGKNILEIMWHNNNPLSVSSYVDNNQSDIAEKQYQKQLQALRKDQEDLWMKYAFQAGAGVLGAFCPEAGLAINLVSGLAEGAATKSTLNGVKLLNQSGYLDKAFVEKYQSGGLSAVSVAGNWVDYFSEMKKLESKIDAENAREKIAWFGSMSSFSVDVSTSTGDAGQMITDGGTEGGSCRKTGTVNTGLYNPKAILEVRDWEENGLGAVLSHELGNEKEQKEKGKEVIEGIKKALIDEGRYTKEAVILLYGGGDILMMDTEKFVETIEDINRGYRGLDRKIRHLGEELSLRTVFQKR